MSCCGGGDDDDKRRQTDTDENDYGELIWVLLFF